ncbi:hypothetical protein [Candidatus Poriferisocius sp.]|uniref:hypothetical protein n=1 Tax=Candidatus Poriferisocius sp. TaxID=3101276 RepID=UPI003B52ED78
MEVVSFSDLGPVLAATLGPVLAFAVASMRYQHLDTLKTREQIASSEKVTRELIASSEKGTREQIASSERVTREQIANSERVTRELIASSEKETRELITRSNRETLQEATRQFQLLSTSLAEHRQETRDGFKEVTASLGDARERITRIEGHLGIIPPPPKNDQG